MVLGKRELSMGLLAVTALVFYFVLLTTATSSEAQTNNCPQRFGGNGGSGGDATASGSATAGQYGTAIQDSTAIGGRGGRGGDFVIAQDTVAIGGDGGDATSQYGDATGGDGGDASVDQSFTITGPNCSISINEDDEEDIIDDEEVILEDGADEDIVFATGPDGEVLDTSSLELLPNTGISNRLSGALTAGLPGGASTVALVVLGTGLGGVSAWRFFGSRRGHSGD